MKKALSILAAATFMSALGGAAIAQQPGPVARFDNGYLDQHPEVTRQLEADPKLVDNRQFVAQHPGLNEYLAQHPEVSKELREHPDRFMRDERVRDNWDDRAHPLASTDHYFDRHPEIAKQLEAHPGLVDDPKYLAEHPELHEFFARHPVAREQWEARPHRFMQREAHYDKRH